MVKAIIVRLKSVLYAILIEQLSKITAACFVTFLMTILTNWWWVDRLLRQSIKQDKRNERPPILLVELENEKWEVAIKEFSLLSAAGVFFCALFKLIVPFYHLSSNFFDPGDNRQRRQRITFFGHKMKGHDMQLRLYNFCSQIPTGLKIAKRAY